MARSVPFGNTFLIVGGRNLTAASRGGPREFLDTIHRFDLETEDWTLLPTRLNTAGHGMTAFSVEGMEFPQCFD